MSYRYDVFICYAYKNKDVFLELKDRFETNGLKVFDSYGIELSQDFLEVIANAILTDKGIAEQLNGSKNLAVGICAEPNLEFIGYYKYCLVLVEYA